jgi:hypothetical protein
MNLEMEKITHSTNEILDIISDMFEDMTDEQEHKLRREIWNRLNDMSVWGYEVANKKDRTEFGYAGQPWLRTYDGKLK